MSECPDPRVLSSTKIRKKQPQKKCSSSRTDPSAPIEVAESILGPFADMRFKIYKTESIRRGAAK
jgi:hypothetical protein